MNYKLIRSNRKTLAIEISIKNGFLIRAPIKTTTEEINKFIKENEQWIKSKIAKVNEAKNFPEINKLNDEEISCLKERARKVIPELVEYYAKLIGVSYGKITIKSQKSRWGSCSSKGNLNFNFLLMLMPDDVINYIIAHEVCHLKEMNHSKNFYEIVLNICPNYKKSIAWLKKNGSKIMARLDG